MLAEAGIYHPAKPVLLGSLSQPDGSGRAEAVLADGREAEVMIGLPHQTITASQLADWQHTTADTSKTLIAVGFNFQAADVEVAAMRVLANPELAQADVMALPESQEDGRGLFIRLEDAEVELSSLPEGRLQAAITETAYQVAYWHIDNDYQPPAMMPRYQYQPHPAREANIWRGWKAKGLKKRRIAPEIAAATETYTSQPFEAGGLVKIRAIDIYGSITDRVFVCCAEKAEAWLAEQAAMAASEECPHDDWGSTGCGTRTKQAGYEAGELACVGCGRVSPYDASHKHNFRQK